MRPSSRSRAYEAGRERSRTPVVTVLNAAIIGPSLRAGACGSYWGKPAVIIEKDRYADGRF